MTFTIREILIGLALVILSIGGLWLYRHGEQHIEAQDAKLAALDQKKVNAVEQTAQSTETQSAIIYKQAIAIPAVPDLGVECVRNAPRGGQLPAAVGVAAAGTGERSADRGTGLAFDPTGPALTRAAEANAQIAYLQRRIKELETEMNGAP